MRPPGMRPPLSPDSFALDHAPAAPESAAPESVASMSAAPESAALAEDYNAHRVHTEAIAERLKDHPEFQKLARDHEAMEHLFSKAHAHIFEGLVRGSTPGQVATEAIRGHWSDRGGVRGEGNILLQKAVHAELGHGEPYLDHANAEDIRTAGEYAQSHPHVHPALRAWARAQYEHTQAQYAKEGVSSVPLYRGIAVGADQLDTPHVARNMPAEMVAALKSGGEYQHPDVPVRVQPLASYSSEPGVAQGMVNKGFGYHHPILMGGRIPTSRILGSHKTGLGVSYESEHVVLGGDHSHYVHAAPVKGTAGTSEMIRHVIQSQ